MGLFGTNYDPPSVQDLVGDKQRLATGIATGGMSEVLNAGTQILKGPMSSITSIIGGIGGTDENKPPQAPPTNPALSQLQQQQQQQAKDFRANMPNMVRMMSENLKSQANQGLSEGLRQTKSDYNTRGLLYSGMRQGKEAQLRGKAQAGLAAGISGINADVENAAHTMDAQAVETGVGIQQTQQAIQNQIYSQAMARMSGNNQMISSALGTGLLAAMLI